ncbi:hypothetical protein ACHQM5_018489 [Ranunculus cassubicifolius]
MHLERFLCTPWPDTSLYDLESSEIFGKQHADPALMQLLKASFTSSKSSIAFPYVSASSEGNKTMEASLMSGFTESCGHGLGVKKIAVLGSCSIDAANYHKLADLQAVHEYLDLTMKNKQKGQKDLIVLCSGEGQDQIWSEGESFSELISSVEKSGASYSVLYASDPSRSKPSSSYRSLDRFLGEGNGSLDSSIFCDGVCQIKSSLLEGFLVAIVLLIILISGLCCMMGIDTPTKFEAPQD